MKKVLLNWQMALVLLLSLGLIGQTNAHPNHGHGNDRERLELHLGGLHLRGENTIYLKREIKNQYPGINLKRYNLKKAVLIAKTKHGRGKAKLRVGNHYTHYKVIDGHPHDFHHPRKFYYRTGFRSPNKHANGPWQIWTKGNFKVKKVVLILERKRGHRHHHHHGDSFELQINI